MHRLAHTTLIGAAACLIAVAPASRADELTVNDPAPPLTLSSWLKGDPIESFDPGSVYVVEFWATWCGPCIAGMPHLSELQQKHADEVTIIGVNIWERDPGAVPAWMDERGDDLMDYAVAMQEGTTMAESWMEAAGERGIPASFIVDQKGRIAWIGHPSRLDEPLERVVAGEWDIATALEKREAERAAEREREAVRRRFEEQAAEAIARFNEAGSAEEAVDAAESILRMDLPAVAAFDYFDQAFFRTTFELEDADRALALVREHRDLLLGSLSGYLMRYATVMLEAEVFDGVRDYGLIVELVDRAHELSPENVEIMAMGALVHMERAIELQRKAIENAEEPEREALDRALARYLRARAGDE